MTNNRERMRDAFDQARRLPKTERAAFLNGLAAVDGPMRAQIEDMLAALDEAGAFLSEPTRELGPSAAAQTTAAPLRERPGTLIGPYKILQLIGEGGFGSVFMAEQEKPVARKVALKIIKLGMDTRQVIARFEAERQALAMMDHPNIARVLDAGATETGRPFFVMELVKGDPIVEYCDKNNLSIEERLELFSQVCNAVQHAHTKGIIHRDIKPSNILVSTQDGRPHTKVIDFGIAKATASKLTEKTLFTEHRALIGTPEYMSPEQAEGTLDIDTRTDVYSLGVLLYELLTGTTPFNSKELRSAAYAEIQRIIREVDPPKPSTRLSANSDTLERVAAHRHTEPKRLGMIVRGELDWIVMKAMEKDRQRRYETANGLAMDVRRYLRGEAVAAAPPSFKYRARKFLRRHRAAAITASLVATALVIGLGAATVGFIEARQERTAAQLALAGEAEQHRVAVHERDKAKEAAEALRQQLYASNLEQVQRIIATDGLDAVRPILDQCDQDLRGWEWDRLNYLADRSETTLPRLSAGVRSIKYSRDGASILVATTDGRIHILDGATLAERRTITVDPPGLDLRDATFSHDGKRVAASDGNEFVHVWDVQTGGLIRSIKTHVGNLQGVALDATGARVAYGTWFSETCIHDVATGERLLMLPDEAGRGRALEFTSDGRHLLVGSLNNSVSMVDTRTGEMVWSSRGAAPVVWSAALSRDETLVASCGADGRLWVRHADTGSLLHCLPTGKGECQSVAFHPDDDLIAVGAIDGLVTLFLTRTGEKLHSYRGHAATVSALDFDPRGRFLVSGDAAGIVKRWHLGSNGPQVAIGHHNALSALAFSSDSNVLCFGGLGSSGGLQFLRFSDMQVEQSELPASQIVSLAISPDGSRIAASCGKPDGPPHIAIVDSALPRTTRWDLPTPDYAYRVIFSPDGESLLASTVTGVLTTWDVRSGQPRWTIGDRKNENGMNAVAYSRDGRSVINAYGSDTIRILDAATGRILREFAVPPKCAACIALNGRGDVLFTGGADGAVRVWDWQAGQLARTMSAQPGAITDMALMPGETRLVTGGADGSVRLWDTRSGRQILLVGRHNGVVMAVGANRDGAMIASCGRDNKLLLWESKPPTPASLDARYERDKARRASLSQIFK